MKTLFSIVLFTYANLILGQNQEHSLINAYKKKSKPLLARFFENWEQEIQPIPANELASLSDTIQDAYNAFTSFYKPHRLDSIGGSEWGNDIYKNVPYLVVQNSLYIYFTDKIYYSEKEIHDHVEAAIRTQIKDEYQQKKLLKKTNGKFSDKVIKSYHPGRNPYIFRIDQVLTDSIMDFRPRIKCNDKRPLYLNDPYKELLLNFLKRKDHSWAKSWFLKSRLGRIKSKNKKEFLESFIKVQPGHSFNSWLLTSHPNAFIITFDKEMKYARIQFNLIYEGGEAILVKRKNQWEMIESKITWIQ